MQPKNEIQPGGEFGRAEFLTTDWIMVLSAGSEDSTQGQTALTRLYLTYWYPLYVFIRRDGWDMHDAQDLTQEFFARLLKNRDLESVRQEKGRFRSFLLVSLKHFLVN